VQAFDAACERLKLDEDDPLRMKLVNEIAALVVAPRRPVGATFRFRTFVEFDDLIHASPCEMVLS
jgi:hypothetical protein